MGSSAPRPFKTGIIQLWGRGPRCSYRVTPEIMRAVESNGEFKPVKLSGLTAEEFFMRLRKLFGSFRFFIAPLLSGITEY